MLKFTFIFINIDNNMENRFITTACFTNKKYTSILLSLYLTKNNSTIYYYTLFFTYRFMIATNKIIFHK